MCCFQCQLAPLHKGPFPSATVNLSSRGGGEGSITFIKEVVADEVGVFDLGILRGGGYQLSVDGVGSDAHGQGLTLVLFSA